jgi:cell division protein FtsI/penicillin-binding protein 2
MPGTPETFSPGGAGERQLSPAFFVLCARLLWGGALVVQLTNQMLVTGPARLQKMQESALQHKRIPGRRGTIYDHNGRKLAWTELAFDLRWTVPAQPEQRRHDLAEFAKLSFLADRLPPLTAPTPGQEIVLCEDLEPSQGEEVLRRFANNPALRVGAVFRRHHESQAVGITLGDVRLIQGLETGISGLEQAYDYLLQANYGMVEVMLDKRGKWIPLSFQEVMEIQPGQDIYLNYELP